LSNISAKKINVLKSYSQTTALLKTFVQTTATIVTNENGIQPTIVANKLRKVKKMALEFV